MMMEGTLVDSTIVMAVAPTENVEKSRDLELRRLKKGNEWCVSRTQAEFAMLY